MNYKGKGEHSVNQLEKMLEGYIEKIHLINSGQTKNYEELNKHNQILKNDISVAHQMIMSECRILERNLDRGKVDGSDIRETIKVLNNAVKISKGCLTKHYAETTGIEF